MTRAILVLTIACCVGLAATAAIAQSDTVGSVRQLKGTASGEKGGIIETLDHGTSVFMGEVLATGAASRLEIGFLDETQLTLGEKAKSASTVLSTAAVTSKCSRWPLSAHFASLAPGASRLPRKWS